MHAWNRGGSEVDKILSDFISQHAKKPAHLEHFPARTILECYGCCIKSQPQIVFQKHPGNIALYTCTNSLLDVALENFTVVREPYSSVQLEWKVVPTDGHHCIRNYNIQIAGPNRSHWEEEIPGRSQSFHFTGLQLIPFQEYTYCVTANLLHGEISLKLTANFTKLQGGLKCDTSYYIMVSNTEDTQT